MLVKTILLLAGLISLISLETRSVNGNKGLEGPRAPYGTNGNFGYNNNGPPSNRGKINRGFDRAFDKTHDLDNVYGDYAGYRQAAATQGAWRKMSRESSLPDSRRSSGASTPIQQPQQSSNAIPFGYTARAHRANEDGRKRREAIIARQNSKEKRWH